MQHIELKLFLFGKSDKYALELVLYKTNQNDIKPRNTIEWVACRPHQ